MQHQNSEPLNSALHSLEKGKFVKLICGASNTDQKQIERLVTVYSLSGVDVVDISSSSDSYISAKSGIEMAKDVYNERPLDFPNFKEPIIMISLNVGTDKHFRKAEINSDLCSDCMNCIHVCPAGALSKNNKKLQFNSNSCYGCARCIEKCNIGAIKLNKSITNVFIPDNCEAIEIHTGNNSFDEIKAFIEDNSIAQVSGLISFSVEAGLFSRNELVDFIQSLTALFNKKIVIQIDGKSMGANNTAASSLQALSAAQVISNLNLNAYIQIAGGVNHLTKSYLKMFNLPIPGVGYGTFARKIILPYIVGLNDTEFLTNLKKCVNITTNLVDNSSNSVQNVV